MLSRIVKLLEAQRALKRGNFQQAISLSEDEAIREHRKAVEIRSIARERLVDRALDRKRRGELSGAFLDLRSAFAGGAKHDRAAALMEELRSELGQRDELRRMEREALERARRLLREGLLDDARLQLEVHAEDSEAARVLLGEIGARIRQADEFVARAWSLAERGEVEGVEQCVDHARRVYRAHPGVEELAREIDRLELQRALEGVSGGSGGGSATEQAWIRLQDLLSESPWLLELEEVRELRESVRSAAEQRVRQLLAGGEFRAAIAELRKLEEILLEQAVPVELEQGLHGVARAIKLREQGFLSAAARALEESERHLPAVAKLDAMSADLEREKGEVEALRQQLAERMSSGHIPEAQDLVDRLLTIHPQSYLVICERKLLDQVHAEPPSTLDEVRSRMRKGELWAARRALLARLLGARSTGIPDDAALGVFAEVEERLDRIDREISEIHRDLAARELPLTELHQRLARLRSLASICVDHPILERLIGGCEQQARSEEQIAVIHEHLRSGDLLPAARLLEELHTAQELDRTPWPVVGSWDQRRVALVRRFLSAASELRARDGWDVLVPLLDGELLRRPAEAVLVRRMNGLRRGLEAARERCQFELERANLCPESDAMGETLLIRARALLPTHPLLERLTRIGGIADRTAQQVRHIEELTERRDYSGAWDELKDIEHAGPFRTQIFDLKRKVQRELGLGERFFLRVEECGEYLVLCGDRIRIGNARASGNDLPVLANISSHHGEIRRKISFHDGVCYEVCPEEGKAIFVDGRPIEGPTTIRDGALLRFGASLEIEFRRPNERSHSALLLLRREFEVQGVDRVILHKKGGRDGFLLLGRVEDAHIPTRTRATAELSMDAQGSLLCRSNMAISIDGHVMSDEEPRISGGAWVECADLRFAVDPG